MILFILLYQLSTSFYRKLKLASEMSEKKKKV